MLPLLNRAIFHVLVLAPGLRGPCRIGPADTLVSFSAAGGRRARSPFAWCLPGVRCFPVLCVCVCFFLPTERSSRLVLTPRESCFQSCLGFEFHRKFLCVFGVGRAFPRPPPARVAGSADGFADVTPASWDRMELLPSRVSLYGIGFHSSVPRAGYAHLCSRVGSAQWFFSLEIPFPGSDIKVMLTQETPLKRLVYKWWCYFCLKCLEASTGEVV